MRKSRRISIIGVIFSSIALIGAAIELFFCIEHKLNILFMPIMLLILMSAVLAANIVNLLRIIHYNKTVAMRGMRK